jgi:hypothetical protein
MRTWIAAWTDEMREADRSLASAVRASVGCPHDADAQLLHLWKLHDYPRALRFRCPACPQDLFVKRFGADPVAEHERDLRARIERRNLELLWGKRLFCDAFAGPRLLAYVGAPHFALVEEMFDDDELLALFQRALGDTGRDARLMAALAGAAAFMAALHDTAVTAADRRVLHESPPPSRAGWPFSEGGDAAVDGEQLARLRWLHAAWMADGLLSRATERPSPVHGGLTSVNLFCTAEGRLRVIDFETLCLGTRYADVGTFTSEIKTAFHLHAGDSFLAEPYIGFFLREYHARADTGLTFPEFTRVQAYFMGERLLFMSRGRTFDDGVKRWLAQAAADVWEFISFVPGAAA